MERAPGAAASKAVSPEAVPAGQDFTGRRGGEVSGQLSCHLPGHRAVGGGFQEKLEGQNAIVMGSMGK